uniref:Bromo domain-containing protein n=1 Tax=Rhabditophanes sp. KR3021 TaxID=114890 RepID=A0AC35UAJ2_9BILA
MDHLKFDHCSMSSILEDRALTPNSISRKKGRPRADELFNSFTHHTPIGETTYERSHFEDKSESSSSKRERKRARKEKRAMEEKRMKLSGETTSIKSEYREECAETPPVTSNCRILGPFQLYCNAILKKLSKKDPDEYFAYPVSVADAPEYDKIITHPMDFQTISGKIEKNDYTQMSEMGHDVNLISENAMTYNPPTSIYYFAAVKLQTIAKYYFSDKFLVYLRYSLPFGNKVSNVQIGLPPLPTRNQLPVSGGTLFQNNTLTDDRKFLHGKPLSTNSHLAAKLAYLDNKDGTTTLNVIGESKRQTYVIGDLVGRLEKGNAGLILPYEPMARGRGPVSYFNHGAFTSFAPEYESTWTSMTKRDSDMLYNCYGSRENTELTFDILNTVDGCGKVYEDAVNKMLDDVTHNEHSVTMSLFKKNEEEIQGEGVESYADLSDEALLEELMSLENLGMDVNEIREIQTAIGVKPIPSKSSPLLGQQGSGMIVKHEQDPRSSMNCSLNVGEHNSVANISGQPTQFDTLDTSTKTEVLNNTMPLDNEGDLDVFMEFFT